jgi:putative chitobiose transport system permease protein
LNPGVQRSGLVPWAFLAPAIAILGLFFLVAFLQVVGYSFTEYAAFKPAKPVGLENYQTVFSSGLFLQCLLNSAAYLLVTPALVIVSLAAALVVDSKLPGTGWTRVAMFLPVVTPTVVASLAWRALYNEDSGLLNAGLQAVGVRPIAWLSERPWTLMSAMLVTLWKGFGFYMMIFLASLMSVPRELKEAASIDGASRTQVFWTVTFPALRPAITLVMVVSSISALKVFDELYVTVKGVPMTHMTVVPLIYSLAFERGLFGLACATGVTLFLVILTLSLFNRWMASRQSGAVRTSGRGGAGGGEGSGGVSRD